MNTPLERMRFLYLFRGWASLDLEAAAKFAKVEKRKRGEILFLQGGACPGLHVLLKGQIQMFRSTPDGREVTLHEVADGALVACAALFLDQTYPAGARVTSPLAELLYLNGPSFLKLLAERPDLSRKMIVALAMRLGELADRLESRQSSPALARMAAWLLDQPSRQAMMNPLVRIVHLESNKKSAASGLGMTPETFSRCLKRLVEEKAIEVNQKDIHLLDFAKLEEISGLADEEA